MEWGLANGENRASGVGRVNGLREMGLRHSHGQSNSRKMGSVLRVNPTLVFIFFSEFQGFKPLVRALAPVQVFNPLPPISQLLWGFQAPFRGFSRFLKALAPLRAIQALLWVFKPFLVFLNLYKGVGVNEGNEIDVFAWCRSCRASWVIFQVNIYCQGEYKEKQGEGWGFLEVRVLREMERGEFLGV